MGCPPLWQGRLWGVCPLAGIFAEVGMDAHSVSSAGPKGLPERDLRCRVRNPRTCFGSSAVAASGGYPRERDSSRGVPRTRHQSMRVLSADTSRHSLDLGLNSLLAGVFNSALAVRTQRLEKEREGTASGKSEFAGAMTPSVTRNERRPCWLTWISRWRRGTRRSGSGSPYAPSANPDRLSRAVNEAWLIGRAPKPTGQIRTSGVRIQCSICGD